MNYSFLPSKIKNKLEILTSLGTSIAQARSSSTIDGSSGESYIVAFKDQLFLFFRESGEREYHQIKALFNGDVSAINIRKDGVHTIFDTSINGEKYSLKFSSFDEKSLLPIIDSWNLHSNNRTKDDNQLSSTPLPNTPPPLPNTTKSISNSEQSTNKESLIESLAIVLMYLSSIDDDIAVEEDQYIRKICNNNKKLLISALNYYKTHTFEQYLSNLPKLNHDQKLCFLANLMELGMCDGILHSAEVKFIKHFASFVNLLEDEYLTIKQVLIIKNNISIL